MNKEYDDIIHLPRHISTKHPQMSMIDRAAQFSPFAALTGYNAAIIETARLTHERIELSEYVKDTLRIRLQLIVDSIKENPEISITYFSPDERKDGGSYVTTTGFVKKINEYERVVIMDNDRHIPMDEIISIEGKLFECTYG